MSLRQALGRLGLVAPRTYGVEEIECTLREGPVRLARWLHPRERPKTIDQDVVDHLRRFIAPGDVVLDIGAHTGDTTVPLALAAGPGGLVLALEPNPYVFPCLARNAALNPGLTRIEALPFAATREDGPVTFRYSDAGFCNGGLHDGIPWWRHGHTFALTVEGRNLARYLDARPDVRDRVRFVKVDAEGHDLAVLQTLDGLLAGRRPFVRAEVFRHSAAPARRALLAFLRERGYRVHRVRGEADLLGPELDEAGLLTPAHYDVFAVPG